MVSTIHRMKISKIGRSCEHLRELLFSYCVRFVASIGLWDHQLELVIGHGLAQLHSDSFEVLECYHFSVIDGKQLEGSLNLLFWLFFVHFRSHDL